MMPNGPSKLIRVVFLSILVNSAMGLSAHSVAPGVASGDPEYTAAQAEAGQKVYAERCSLWGVVYFSC